MKRSTLPHLTPALAAFAAGRTIQPVGYVAGRPVYPIAGGAPDEPPEGGEGDGTEGKPEGEAKPDAATETAKGYPDNTKVEDMQPAEQAAYWRAQSQKHEGRNKELLKVTGGKYGDDLQADFEELERLRQERLTDSERAVEEAKKAAREEVTREYGPKSVLTAFELLLGDMPEEERNAEIELLDLTKFLNDSGSVDTAKVRRHAEKIAPADKGEGRRRDPDFGAGRRREHQSKSGVSAGAEMFENGRTNKGAPAATK